MLFALMLITAALFLLMMQTCESPSFCGAAQGTGSSTLLLFSSQEPGTLGRPDTQGVNDFEDDSDMKIADGVQARKNAGASDPDEAEEVEFTLLKNSGELARAHKLGGKICEHILQMDNAVDMETLALNDENTHLQLRLMMTFCAFYTVEKHIASKVLQSVIINEFYDRLKDRQPDYYNSLNETGSFSFYYLCVRGADKGECCIGQTYAKLVDSGADQSVAKAAQRLFDRFSGIVTDLIRSEGFVA